MKVQCSSRPDAERTEIAVLQFSESLAIHGERAILFVTCRELIAKRGERLHEESDVVISLSMANNLLNAGHVRRVESEEALVTRPREDR